MANIVIDQIMLSGWTGEGFQYNFRVTSDDNHSVQDSVTVNATSTALAVNTAIVNRAIDVIEADGASEVGLLNTKMVVGGAMTL